jgi:hypothetical protein
MLCRLLLAEDALSCDAITGDDGRHAVDSGVDLPGFGLDAKRRLADRQGPATAGPASGIDFLTAGLVG